MGNLKSLVGSDGSTSTTSQEVKRSESSDEDELSDAGVGDSGILDMYIHARTWSCEVGQGPLFKTTISNAPYPVAHYVHSASSGPMLARLSIKPLHDAMAKVSEMGVGEWRGDTAVASNSFRWGDTVAVIRL